MGKKHERDGGRQREAGPSREAAEIAGPHEADEKPDLTTGRTGQELAQPDEIGICVLVKSAASHNELFTEIPEVSDRPAEAGEAKLQEGKEDFNVGAALTLVGLGWMRDDRHALLL